MQSQCRPQPMRINPFNQGTPITNIIEREIRSLGRRICTLHPSLNKIALTVWSYYIQLYPSIGNTNIISHLRSPAPIDPFRVVDIDPDSIEYMVEYGAMPQQARTKQVFPNSKFKYAGAVIGGNWDQTTRRFEDSDLYQSFKAHFEHHTRWEQTSFFETTVDHIENGITMWGCTTKEEFKARCKELDELYDAINQHGFLSQRELMESSVPDPVRDNDALPYHVRLVNDELAVCIGRDGELLFKDGRDRLAIAKLLNLETVPAWILIRHSQWQRLREAITLDPSLLECLPAKIRAHPDLDVPD